MQRRDFLKVGSTGLAGMAMGGITLNAQPEKRANTSRNTFESWKKAFMLDLFPSAEEYTIREQFELLHEAGFDGVEPSSGLDRSGVIAAKEATGLDIPSVVVSTHWDYPLSSPDPEIREKGLEGLQMALRDAEEYGAGCVLFVPGTVTEEISYDEAYERSQEEIRKVLPLAEELDLVIAIENVWNQFLLSPLEAARYVDEFNSPHVGWYFDIGNIMNFGWPEQWIRILGDRIAMIHLKEFSRSKRDDEGLWKGFEVDYLEGDNNWEEIMNALQDIGYRGYGIAEPPYRDEEVSGEEWLGKYVAERMDKIFAM